MNIKELRLNKLRREAEQAKNLGMETKFMVSSLKCPEHYESHSELVDLDKAECIYDFETVSDNCTCSLIQILLDTDGTPMNKGIIEQAKKLKNQ
ncbi:hypothetical protein [Photobacterium angustum]|uniref:hypothetical protein n=1 Tax=Photobacterium angustum TaxID=661 RepID=UPI0005E8732F|nr:hypothetical protein [Photobacterium angustum]KJG17689.1 hypothetical protein UA33_06845 [Photobacterium angustum]KJG24893.1 hypothetical protein UA39_06400 [Photobacterium angustum]KJG32976.1 hypothetical protein UA36_05940 [Photobacterium angustum]PSW97599.1 hypothetical protein C0W79_04995 [Photobacterium angustum]PSW99888.1 hypothetical protein C0W87_21005 [Photobacterium angustum]